jgi:hypothetical protein
VRIGVVAAGLWAVVAICLSEKARRMQSNQGVRIISGLSALGKAMHKSYGSPQPTDREFIREISSIYRLPSFVSCPVRAIIKKYPYLSRLRI